MEEIKQVVTKKIEFDHRVKSNFLEHFFNLDYQAFVVGNKTKLSQALRLTTMEWFTDWNFDGRNGA